MSDSKLCPLCGFSGQSRESQNFIRHVQTCAKQLHCSDCNISFIQKNEDRRYARHRLIEHLWEKSCKCGKLSKNENDSVDSWKRKVRDHKNCPILVAEVEKFEITIDYKKPIGFDEALNYLRSKGRKISVGDGNLPLFYRQKVKRIDKGQSGSPHVCPSTSAAYNNDVCHCFLTRKPHPAYLSELIWC